MSLIGVRVRYFALFREQRGCAQELLRVEPCTAASLYSDLAAKHGFTLDSGLVRAAVNEAFAPIDTILKDGDEVVFVPPVAGG